MTRGGGVDAPGSGTARRRSTSTLVLIGLSAGLVFLGFLALGTWQVQRLGWKRDLIARVEARVHAPPGAPPARSDWPRLGAAADEYRHVLLEGRFLPLADTLVQAVTERGGGSWVMTPLRLGDGALVLVNRGFVPLDAKDPAAWAPPEGAVTVTGLLRLPEPGGAFLRANDPAAGRWYSRDVAAIAAARGLPEVAPYFVDADARGDEGLPVGGLTVIAFPNNHLVYAITWYALALMVAVGFAYLLRYERRLRAA